MYKTKLTFSWHLYFRQCRDRGDRSEIRRCKIEVEKHSGERNWTLTAENKLGKVELLDRADLIKRGTSFKELAYYVVKCLFGY